MKIHLVGIGGIAMGNLAAMLKQTGHRVSGSDGALYPPMSVMLKKWGIGATTFGAGNIGRADLYVIGNAVSRGNVEVEAILDRGLPYTSMAAALADFFLRNKKVIVVAGTHGKTTTTFLVDHMLSSLDRPPGLFAGGIRADGMSGFRLSDSEYFVIEGDEYDTAFFDKASKFLHYRPRYLILTSVDFDHADIFSGVREYRHSFKLLLRTIPARGLVVACRSNHGVKSLLVDYEYSPVRWYGKSSRGAKSAKAESKIGPEESQFPLVGVHNLLNARAALVLGDHLGLPSQKLPGVFRDFPGVLRRQQKRLQIDQNIHNGRPIVFIEDFAHHPTEVRETIAAMRRVYPGYRLHALFEPRSATTHRDIFQRRYSRALAAADQVYLCELYNPGKVSPARALNVKKLQEEIGLEHGGRPGRAVYYGKGPRQIQRLFSRHFRPSAGGDVVLAMSNGAFGGIYPDLEKKLKEFQKGRASSPGAGKKSNG